MNGGPDVNTSMCLCPSHAATSAGWNLSRPHAPIFSPGGAGSGVTCHTIPLGCNRWRRTSALSHIHTARTLTSQSAWQGPDPWDQARKTEAGIWARTSGVQGERLTKSRLALPQGQQRIVWLQEVTLARLFENASSLLFASVNICFFFFSKGKNKGEVQPGKEVLFIPVLDGDEAGDSSVGAAGGRTYTGRHGWLQITVGWLTCCTLCNFYLTSVSLIPLYLFLFIGIFFFSFFFC